MIRPQRRLLRSARIAVALLLAFAPGTRALAQPADAMLDPALRARIESLVTQTMRENRIPGLAIGIVRDAHAVYSRGFGVTDINTGRAVTPQTVFQMGSDSKMFVGIALMQLAAAGAVDLEAPLTRYLPWFRIADPRYPRITIRQLLSHRSGLPWCANYVLCNKLDYEYADYDAGALERHVRRLDRVVLETEPGGPMHYSDLGFEILGEVIATASGQDFESWVRQHVFDPLGMRHSSFLLRDFSPLQLAQPHVLKPALMVNRYFPYSRQHAPSSTLFSTADDMNRFALGVLGRGRPGSPQLLPPAAWDTMWSAQTGTNIPSRWETSLGLGWFLGGEPAHRLVGHSGGDIGFDSEFILAPEDGVAVSVMINHDFVVEGLALDIVQMVLDANAARQAAAR